MAIFNSYVKSPEGNGEATGCSRKKNQTTEQLGIIIHVQLNWIHCVRQLAGTCWGWMRLTTYWRCVLRMKLAMRLAMNVR